MGQTGGARSVRLAVSSDLGPQGGHASMTRTEARVTVFCAVLAALAAVLSAVVKPTVDAGRVLAAVRNENHVTITSPSAGPAAHTIAVSGNARKDRQNDLYLFVRSSTDRGTISRRTAPSPLDKTASGVSPM